MNNTTVSEIEQAVLLMTDGKVEDYHSIDRQTLSSYSSSSGSYELQSQLNPGEVLISIHTIVPLPVALPCYGYVIPVLVLLTVIFNSFIVLVLSDKTLRTTTNRILLSMTVMATLTGIACLPWFLYYYTFKGYQVDKERGMPAIWCTLHRFLSEIMPRACHTATIWLTVLLSMRRYCTVSTPVSGTPGGRVPVRIPIVLICIAAVVLELPIVFSRRTISFEEQNRTYCVQALAPWVMAIGPGPFFIGHVWFSVVFVHAGPCILLVIYMLLLIRFIRRRQAKRRRRKSSLIRSRTATSNVKMLAIILCIFLVTEIPAVIIYTVHVLNLTFRVVPPNRYLAMNIALILRNVFIVASSSFNLFVYLLMSQQFRKVSLDLSCRILAALLAVTPSFLLCCPLPAVYHARANGNLKGNLASSTLFPRLPSK